VQRDTNSARSHYDRRDLERLFELQPRSAQILMSALPTVPVGRAFLVEREALTSFLKQLNEAEDAAQEFARLREGKGTTVRRKLRSLVLKEVDTTIATLPSSLQLAPGELRVTFQTVEELAEAMMHLAAVLKYQLEEFMNLYEPPKPVDQEEQTRRAEELADMEYFRNWGRT
jgi:hypothetical protein